MTNRFDYVAYDDIAADQQSRFKQKLMEIEDYVEHKLMNGRAKSLVITKLEEAYMWIGKAIRDEQIQTRNAYQEQPARGNS